MDDKQIKRLEELRFKKDITPKELEEYQELVNMQYKTGHNDPKPKKLEKNK